MKSQDTALAEIPVSLFEAIRGENFVRVDIGRRPQIEEDDQKGCPHLVSWARCKGVAESAAETGQ